MGYAFEEQAVNIDELLMLPDSLCDRVMKEIQTFLNNQTIFSKYNVLHRRGYLFYGPPGSGKTSLVQQITASVIKQGGLVLICNTPTNLEMGLKEIRSVEKDRFIVCMLEDIDALIHNYGEREILAVLDGESQINKVLNIATTNYPQKLDKRIVSRPRRFDRVIEIGFPEDALRRNFFQHKMKLDNGELDQWVKATKNFSFAACTDLLISVKCLGNDFDASVKILQEMMATYDPKKKKKE
jgi:SpoVK/Ycf46/Vps4 family AAA+-type ATPase